MNRLFASAVLVICSVFVTGSGVAASDAASFHGEKSSLCECAGWRMQYREGYVSGHGNTAAEAHAAALSSLPSGATVIRTSFHESSAGRWTCRIRYKAK